MDILTARQVASELYTASTERLREISKMPNVSLSVQSLIGIQRAALSYGGYVISAEELILLDLIAKAFSRSPKRYSAGNITTTEKQIADTLADMMTKYSFLYPSYSSPCTADQAFGLGGEATDFGKSHSFSLSDLIMFSSSSNDLSVLKAALHGADEIYCRDGICVAADQYLRKERKLKSNKKYSVFFAYAQEGSDMDGLIAFSKDAAKSSATVASFAAKGEDLLIKLLEHSLKITLLSDNIPSQVSDDILAEKERAYRSVTDFFFGYRHGKCAVAVITKNKSSAKRSLSALAAKHGIELYNPIEINSIPRFTVLSRGRIFTSLPISILRTVMHTEALNVSVHPQTFDLPDLPESSTFEYKEANDTVYTVTASLTDPSKCFASSINAIIYPFIVAAYSGKNTLNSSFSLSVNASLPMSDSSIGASYASLLGIYRAITEMGVSTVDSSLTITDATPSVSVALKTTSFKEKTEVVTALSPEEMLKRLKEDGEMPDFSALRALINGQNI